MSAIRRAAITVLVMLTVSGSALLPALAHAQSPAPASAQAQAMLVDGRIRTISYSDDRVYRLRGYAGFQIDLQFQSGETFVGLAAGDIDALSYVAESNHLFLKPKAESVRTNLTVLTSQRAYHFDYSASRGDPDVVAEDVVYVLRFVYPAATTATSEVATHASAARAAADIDAELAQASVHRSHNEDYWYCGDGGLRPVAAWDDGVHTYLRFAAHADLPALFVRNDDHSESLLNFSIEDGDVVVHRVARQFVLRRGRQQGCIVNRAFAGGGQRLQSGTVAPVIERATIGGGP